MKKKLCIKKMTFVFLFFLCGASYGQSVEIRGGELQKAYQLKKGVACSNYSNFLGEAVTEYTPAVGKKLFVLQATMNAGYSISKFDYQLVAYKKYFFCLSVSTSDSSFDMKTPEIVVKEKTDVFLLFEGPENVDVCDLKFMHNTSLKHPSVEAIKFATDKKLPIELKGAKKAVASKSPKASKKKKGAPIVAVRKGGKVGTELLRYVPAKGVRSVIGFSPSSSGCAKLKGRLKSNVSKIIKAFKGADNVKAILAVGTIKNEADKSPGAALVLIRTKAKVSHKRAAGIIGKNVKPHESKDTSVTGDAKICYSLTIGIGGPQSYVVKLNDFTYLVGDRKVCAATALFRNGDISGAIQVDNKVMELIDRAQLLDGIWGVLPDGNKTITKFKDIDKNLGNISVLGN